MLTLLLQSLQTFRLFSFAFGLPLLGVACQAGGRLRRGDVPRRGQRAPAALHAVGHRRRQRRAAGGLEGVCGLSSGVPRVAAHDRQGQTLLDGQPPPGRLLLLLLVLLRVLQGKPRVDYEPGKREEEAIDRIGSFSSDWLMFVFVFSAWRRSSICHSKKKLLQRSSSSCSYLLVKMNPQLSDARVSLSKPHCFCERKKDKRRPKMFLCARLRIFNGIVSACFCLQSSLGSSAAALHKAARLFSTNWTVIFVSSRIQTKQSISHVTLAKIAVPAFPSN